MFIAPKIIIFATNELKFIDNNREFLNNISLFYGFEGIVTSYDKIKKF